ncbi:hypothetical protein FYJ68_04205 [Olsenella sp. CA-Schmier-601-WT-1]|uniref:ISXO2-like transposase domain-containing protein n=1 Tax=Olsenella porci TaxID=2652279 RepID=A0A6N7X9V5_9ACTN|nr:hypothetical protein [Olsenella porci]
MIPELVLLALCRPPHVPSLEEADVEVPLGPPSSPVVTAIGCDEHGWRRVLGPSVADAESHDSWLAFPRGVRARRVDGVTLVTAVPDSLSGNHSRSAAGFEMPRPPRRRGRDGTARGLGGDKVCVAVAVDERGGTRVAVAGRRRGTAAGYHAFLVSCGVRRGCVLVSDLDQCLPAAALGTGAANERYPSSDRAALNRVNAACSAPRHWLARFRGVSTRRLANYLAWYKWSLDARRTESPADLLAEPTALTRWDGYASTTYPHARWSQYYPRTKLDASPSQSRKITPTRCSAQPCPARSHSCGTTRADSHHHPGRTRPRPEARSPLP